jgi:hypothetical protein
MAVVVGVGLYLNCQETHHHGLNRRSMSRRTLSADGYDVPATLHACGSRIATPWGEQRKSNMTLNHLMTLNHVYECVCVCVHRVGAL